MMPSSHRLIAVLAILQAGIGPGETTTANEPANDLRRAEAFLESHAVIDLPPTRPDAFESIASEIDQVPDPESKFGYLVFSLARHSGKLLKPNQAAKLDALIEARQSAEVNWHDVRNLVRVRAQMALWNYAAKTETERVTERKKEWETWTDLRLAYMFQEFVAGERFQRAAWNLLTEEQRRSLRGGAWDRYLKKSTGHGRLFSADKQILRILGKPDFPEAFDESEKTWRERWDRMWHDYQAAALFERKRESSMDLAGEAFAIHAWRERYAPAFRAFAEHEREAIRDLLQGGYTLDAEARAKLAGYREMLGTEALAKYADCPRELLAILDDEG